MSVFVRQYSRRLASSLLFLAVLFSAFAIPAEAQTFRSIPQLSFTKPFGGNDPLPQILTIASAGATFNYTYGATTSSGGSWLSVAAGSGCGLCSTPSVIVATVSANVTLAAGTYSGQITVTSQSGSTTMMIPVALTIAPVSGTFPDNLQGQMSFSLKTAGTAITSQQIQIRNGGTGSLAWNLAASTADGGNWLTVSGNSGTAPSVVTVGVTVANLPGAGITAGSFIGVLSFTTAGGNVTVPVCVVVGDNILSQVNGISFNRVFGGINPLPQSLTIPSTGTAFNFTVTSATATGGSWLAATTGDACGLCTTPEEVIATVSASVTLPVGTYTGQIVITTQNGNMSITVPVTLTIAAATGVAFPDNLAGQMSFSVVTGGTSITSQQIQIRNGGTGNLSWTLATSTSDAGNWLSVSLPSGVAPSVITVNISVANLPSGGLIAGTFIGQLVFNTAGGNITVPVSVVVGANVFRQVNAISFTKVFGGANPLPQNLAIPSTGTAFNYTVTSSTATGGSWLSVSTGDSCGLCTTPEVITASVTATATLAAGTYTGQIVVTSQSGNLSITVPVTLTVVAVGGTYFDNMPGQVGFTMATGGTTITSQQLQIRNGGAGSLNWSLTGSTSDGGNWLTISATSGTAPSMVTIGVNPANLPNLGLIAGTFNGQLVFTSASGSVTVPVSVVVGANVFRQINAISFTKLFGGANPLPQTLTIPSTGTVFNFTFTSSTGTGGSWLSVSSGDSCGLCGTPETLTVSVSPSTTLAAGTYTGQVVVTSQSGDESITVPVTLSIEPASAAYFDNVPGQMSFSIVTASGNPPSQTVQIRNAGSGVLNWSVAATTSDGGNWITLSTSTGTAPQSVTVGIVASNLPNAGLIAGTFTGELVFLSQDGSNSVTMPVSVVVGASVFVQQAPLTFSKSFGGTNPLSQAVSIASTATAFNFTWAGYTGTGGNWLSVTSGNSCGLCTTPTTLTANIIANAALAAGTYTGQILVISQSGTMAMTIPVTLNVGSTTSLAVMTAPTPNSTLSGSSVTFSWSAGAGATAYWLDVNGTCPTCGGTVFGQNVGLATSQTVNGLPTAGGSIYVRLWTLISGTWSYNDYVYTAATLVGTKATMSTPTPGSTLSGASVTFTWVAGSGASAYWLDINNTCVACGGAIFGQNVGLVTSQTVSGLPTDGSAVYVRLWTLLGSTWQSNDYTYTASTSGGSTKGAMSTPTPGTTLTGSSVTFTWTPGTGAAAYWLDVNNACAGCGGIIFGKNVGLATSQAVTGLPTNGSTVYVRLWTLLGSTWQSTDYTYTASGAATKATMTSPVPGTTLTGSSVTFTWAAGSGASAYWLDVNNACAGCGGIIFGQNVGLATSQAVSGLPTNGSTVYVRLWTLLGSTWQSNDYTYTASGTATKATMTSPVPGTTLTGSSVTFTWAAGTGASAYWLDVNNVCAGCGGIIFGQNVGLATSQAVSGLPTNGSTVYVRLWTLIGSTWQSIDYTYTASGTATKATMSTPAPGSMLSGSSVTFTWAAGTGASAYWLDVNNVCAGCGGTIFGQNVGLATSQAVSGLPTNGSTVYVRLWTLIGSTWQSNDYTYTAF